MKLRDSEGRSVQGLQQQTAFAMRSFIPVMEKRRLKWKQ